MERGQLVRSCAASGRGAVCPSPSEQKRGGRSSAMPWAVAHPRWVYRGVRWRRLLLQCDSLLRGASARGPSDPRASAFAPLPGINGLAGRAPEVSRVGYWEI